MTLLSSVVYSQNEYFNGDARWHHHYSCFWGGPGMENYNLYSYFTGETEINGYTYKIMVTPVHTEMAVPRTYIRSEGKKIYAINPQTNEDELMYDFDVEVGEIMPMHHDLNLDEPLMVSEISTITIAGEERKVISLVTASNGSVPVAPIIIEGIGNSISGLFGFIYGWFDCSISPVCYSIDGTSYSWEINAAIPFQNFQSAGGVCAIADNIGENEKARIQVYPNPATASIRLSSDIPPNSTYSIRNLMGTTIITGNTGSIEIPIETLSSGIYLISIGLKGEVTSIPFVKTTE